MTTHTENQSTDEGCSNGTLAGYLIVALSLIGAVIALAIIGVIDMDDSQTNVVPPAATVTP